MLGLVHKTFSLGQRVRHGGGRLGSPVAQRKGSSSPSPSQSRSSGEPSDLINVVIEDPDSKRQERRPRRLQKLKEATNQSGTWRRLRRRSKGKVNDNGPTLPDQPAGLLNLPRPLREASNYFTVDDLGATELPQLQSIISGFRAVLDTGELDAADSAAISLSILAETERGWDKLRELNAEQMNLVLEGVTAMMQSGDSIAAGNAAGALFTLAETDAGRQHILAQRQAAINEMLLALIALLWCEDANAVGNAAGTLSHLILHPSGYQRLMTMSGQQRHALLSGLIIILHSEDMVAAGNATGALANLVEQVDGVGQLLALASAELQSLLSGLRQMLGSVDQAGVQTAAWVLSRLVQDARGVALLLSEEPDAAGDTAIATLVSVLHAEDQGADTHTGGRVAAGVLGQLARLPQAQARLLKLTHPDGTKVSSSLVTGLVLLLRCGSVAAAQNATGTLFVLAEQRPWRELMLAAQPVQCQELLTGLVDILGHANSPHPGFQAGARNAAGALAALAEHPQWQRLILKQQPNQRQRIFDGLVALLKGSDKGIDQEGAENAAGALFTLSESQQGRTILLTQAPGPLHNMLEALLQALHTRGNAAGNAAGMLVALMESETGQHHLLATTATDTTVAVATTATAARTQCMLQGFVGMLHSPDDLARANGIAALASVAEMQQGLPCLLAMEEPSSRQLIHGVCRLLRCPDPMTAGNGAAIIAALSKTEEGNAWLLGQPEEEVNTMLLGLTNILQSGDLIAARGACTALSLLRVNSPAPLRLQDLVESHHSPRLPQLSLNDGASSSSMSSSPKDSPKTSSSNSSTRSARAGKASPTQLQSAQPMQRV